MNRLLVPKPISAGIFLSYKCTSKCKHCMYACSPQWKADWISETDLRKILAQLHDKIQPSPLGPHKIAINYGLYFTGGEPFLNFDLLLRAVEMAYEIGIPSTFVETNCFWCIDDVKTREKLLQLKSSGLDGILISVNPFILEEVPFERTKRAVGISREIFKENAIVYQEIFHHQFREFNVEGTLSFEEYLQKVRLSGLSLVELLPMGRAVYKLEHLYKKYPAKRFFGESCREDLMREWHIHIDNYGNYMTGYCGGISLGDGRDMGSIWAGINVEEMPILNALLSDLERLYIIGVKEFGYKERKEGYVSKCHFCLDIRRHIAQQADRFKELSPREFYFQLE